jgi:signal transduction histidine kinase
VTRAGRTLLFLLAAVPLGALALALLIAGWVAVPVLAITPLVVPALVAFRVSVGGLARLDADLAGRLVGATAEPPVFSRGPSGFWHCAGNVLRDESFWKQQAYLLLRLSVGFMLAVLEWTLVVASLGLVTLPLWYWTTDVQVLDGRHVDSFGRALLWVPVGLVGLGVAFALIGPLTSLSRRLVDGLLEGVGEEQALSKASQLGGLRLHALAYAALNALLLVIWALTTPGGNFWPAWPLLTLGVPLALHAWVVLVDGGGRYRALVEHAGVSLVFAVFFVLIWALTGHGNFWPAWPILVLGVVLAIHAGVVLAQRDDKERIAVLEETRAGAVEQQETELERIERDLHDGAQARLVALGMSLGLAEQKLATDPAAAQALIAEAQQGTRDALEELRSLARGIHPPVLADRGLEAAIVSLAQRTPLKVDIAVDLGRRPPRAVESAAYFVVAESLANVGKHADAEHVDVRVRSNDERVVVEVVDDGHGGANPNGGGLLGLTRRVEALDGSLEVRSPAGGPTTIRAVIPCAS